MPFKHLEVDECLEASRSNCMDQLKVHSLLQINNPLSPVSSHFHTSCPESCVHPY